MSRFRYLTAWLFYFTPRVVRRLGSENPGSFPARLHPHACYAGPASGLHVANTLSSWQALISLEGTVVAVIAAYLRIWVAIFIFQNRPADCPK